MAIVTSVGNAILRMDLWEPGPLLEGGNVLILEADEFEIEHAPFYYHAYGTGITYEIDEFGLVTFTGGTITGVNIIDAGTGINYEISGFSKTIDEFFLSFSGDTNFFLSSFIGGNDTITGTASYDVLYVFSGDDVLYGESGNDLLIGGSGDDTLDGGDDFDTVSYEFSGGEITLDFRVAGAKNIGAGNGNDTFVSIEEFRGSNFSDTFWGANGSEEVYGLGGNDVFHFEDGAIDYVYARDGDDSFYFGETIHPFTQILGEGGWDTLFIEGDYSGGPHVLTGIGQVESLVLAAGYDYELNVQSRLTELDASAIGAANFVSLDLSGVTSDVFFYYGGAADETIIGADTQISHYHLEDWGIDSITLDGLEGYVYFGASFTEADFIQGRGYDRIFLDGDYSAGMIFDAVNIDVVHLAPGNDYKFTTGPNLLNEFYTAVIFDGKDLGAGDSLYVDARTALSNFVQLFGGAGEDTLLGGTQVDAIYGRGGNDTIYGGLDFDELFGGTGADTYLFLALDELKEEIFDFSWGDTLDFSAIGGLTFIGQQAFSGTAGEFRYNFNSPTSDPRKTSVEFDIDGDGTADTWETLAIDHAHLAETSLGSNILQITSFEEVTRPVLINWAPRDETDVETDDRLEHFFDENVMPGTGAIEIRRLATGSLLEAIDVESARVTFVASGSLMIVYIDPASYFNVATDYYVTLPEGTFTDIASNAALGITDTTTYAFRTKIGTWGTVVDFENDAPVTYMERIRDFDGNDLGGNESWVLIGSADIQLDGDIEYILVNDEIGRWASVGPADDGKVYYNNHGWGGDTRVVGIYIDPLVESGEVEQGSPFDSQQRFQNDLYIGNINAVLGEGDFDGDGLQEIYFGLTDETAYLHAYMHADGNIRYANYQNEQQMIDYLEGNGFGEETWGDWLYGSSAAAVASSSNITDWKNANPGVGSVGSIFVVA